MWDALWAVDVNAAACRVVALAGADATAAGDATRGRSSRSASAAREGAIDQAMQAYAADRCEEARAHLGRAAAEAFPALPGARDALARRRRGFTPVEAALLRDDAEGLALLARAGVEHDWPLHCFVDAIVYWRRPQVLVWQLHRSTAAGPADVPPAILRAVLAAGDPELGRAAFTALRHNGAAAALCGADTSLLCDDLEADGGEEGASRPSRVARYPVALAALEAAWLGSTSGQWEQVERP